MDNKLKIINYLGKHQGESFTMHELSKIIRIPYATFYRVINDMKELVKMQTIGKSKVVSLNKENPVLKSYLTISSDEEKNDYLKRQPIMRKIASGIDTKEVVILFGSYAKGNQRESSDIDLLIINNNGKKSLSFSKYEILFKKKINPLFFTRSEFVQMLKDKDENVGKQALKDHIILNNPSRFWEGVLNG